MRQPPTGTVTFLFSDIEGSTRRWDLKPRAMSPTLARHDALVQGAIESHHGFVFKSIGDAFCAAFASAGDALAAALAVQQGLRALPPSGDPADEISLRVRIALYTGVAERRDGDYFGQVLNRVDRLVEVGYGGQVLLSQTTCDLVQDELSADLSLRDLGAHRLRDLQRPEHVYQLLHRDLPSEYPPLKSLDASFNNLPLQVTSFVGREKEMAEVKQLLATTRLLTLTGAGGTGKTRLSLQAAAELLGDYPEGVWLVELASLTDATLVPQAVATVLRVREEPGESLARTLLEYLRPRRLLLILDNCEHLLAACATLVETLVRSCAHLQILATSRAGLNIGGEQIYPVPSLSSPDPQQLPSSLESVTQFAAVRLFLDRARLAQPSFILTRQNAPFVARVCDHVDGIPLLIELATARLKVLSIEQIAQRLDNLFLLLKGGSRTALPRHQTVGALIDWSYDLLSEAERLLLRRLCVFAGGFTLEAAEAVCAGEGIEPDEVLDLLGQLVEKSLVLKDEPEEEARYRVPETIRQYGEAKLRQSAEEAALRERHRDWFLTLAEEALPQLLGSDEAVWQQRLVREYENLRAALGGAVKSGVAGGLPTDPARLSRWGKIIEGLAPAYRRSGRARAAWSVLADYLDLCQACGYAEGLVRGYTLMGRYEFLNPDLARAIPSGEIFEKAIAVGEAHGLHDWVIYPKSHLAYSLAAYGTDLERAESLARACLPRAEPLQDPLLLRRLCTCLIWIARHRGDLEALQEAFQESITWGGPLEFPFYWMLGEIEESCHQQGADARFQALCRFLAEGYARGGCDPPLQQWYLEPAHPMPLPEAPSLAEDWERPTRNPALEWLDPTGHSRMDRITRPGWLGLYPAQDADLFHKNNYNAPRLLTRVRGDFVAQARVELGRNTEALGGLVVWQNERHFVRLELQRRTQLRERLAVLLEECVTGRHRMVGWGQCDPQPMWLRIERVGDNVRGLCSVDGERWLSCGTVSLPQKKDTEHVGLMAIWHPPDSHAWFEHFLLWGGTGAWQDQSALDELTPVSTSVPASPSPPNSRR